MIGVFERLIDPLIAREGGYVDDPRDAGGETNWGITIATARRYGYVGPMRSMPRNEAARIYRERYWKEPHFDWVATVSEALAEELFDTGVNMGPAVAVIFLQRALNALNRQGADYKDLKADGDLGPVTFAALRTFVRKRGAEGLEVLLKALNCLQGARYVELAELRPANEAFVFGWLRHRVGALGSEGVSLT